MVIFNLKSVYHRLLPLICVFFSNKVVSFTPKKVYICFFIFLSSTYYSIITTGNYVIDG